MRNIAAAATLATIIMPKRAATAAAENQTLNVSIESINIKKCISNI